MSEVERLSKRYCIKIVRVSHNLRIRGLVFNFASTVFRLKANDSNHKTPFLVIHAGYEEKIHNPRFLKRGVRCASVAFLKQRSENLKFCLRFVHRFCQLSKSFWVLLSLCILKAILLYLHGL